MRCTPRARLASAALLLLVACSENSGDGGGSCEDECPPAGRRCSLGGVQVCGAFDSDDCLEWSSTVPCASTEVCAAGRCEVQCEDACVVGARECVGAGERRCGNFDEDPCVEWSAEMPCGLGELCEPEVGACVTPGECTHLCEAGRFACSDDGTGVRPCGDFDGDGCREWGSADACSTGRCENGRCAGPTDCQAEPCGPGDVRCEGAFVQRCGDFNGDRCLEWGRPEACDTGMRCMDGRCSGGCEDECSEGARQCEATDTSYRVCGRFDGDPCVEWSSVFLCASDESCFQGFCQADCTDECGAGDRRCTADQSGVEVCGNFDDDPCLEFGATMRCEVGSCEGRGVCVDDCSDECERDGRACAVESGGVITCGNFDPDACLEWSAASPCPPAQSCDGGACIAAPVPDTALLIIELATGDARGVFVELWGETDAPLRGYALELWNAAGQRSLSLPLDGDVPPDRLFVVAPTVARNDVAAARDQAANFDPGDDGGSLRLVWGEVVVDAVAWGEFSAPGAARGEGSPAAAPQVGQSLRRRSGEAGLPVDSDDNAADFIIEGSPSPGRLSGQGAPCQADADCDAPPAFGCDGDTMRAYALPGRCVASSCVFDPVDVPCVLGCEDGWCRSEGPQLRVPEDFGSVPAAANAAQNGETVFVAPGAYDGDVDLRQGVTIRGSGRDQTTLAGTVRFQARLGALEDLRLENRIVHEARGGEFRIEGCTLPGVTALVRSVTGGGSDRLTLALLRNRFDRPGVALDFKARGFDLRNPGVIDARVENNIFSGQSRALWIRYENSDTGDAMRINVDFRHNTVRQSTGPMLVVQSEVDDPLTVENNLFLGGGVGSSPLRVEAPSPAAVTLRHNFRDGTDPYEAVPVVNEGNFDGDARVADALRGDFRLLPSSPCVDTAIALPEVTFDYERAPRPQDGNGDGTPLSDIGAYELSP